MGCASGGAAFRKGIWVVLGVMCCTADFTKSQGICSDGWEMCASTGQCVPQKCSGGVTSMSTSRCRDGLVFCASAQACVPPCPARLTNPQDKPRMPICMPGNVFCASSGKCIHILDSCSSSNGIGGGNSNNGGVLSRCPSGSSFCLARGGCVPGGCTGGGSSQSPSGRQVIKCQPGMMFCLASGMCVPEGQCGNLNTPIGRPHITRCSPGQVFCLASGTCMTGGCTSGPGQPSPGVGRIVCPSSMVFCLSSGTCEAAGTCGARPSFSTMCPRNYVYCLEKRECVPAERGCTVRKGPTCPPGKVFCIQSGACKKDCQEESPNWAQDSATCPRVDSDMGNQNPEYSTCLSTSHCPMGHTCCPSPENLHLQCVSSNGSNIASQGNQAQSLLNLTCIHLEQDIYDTGMNCSSPEDCPAGSVCCVDKCKTQGGRQMCPPSTLYCAEEESCKRAGSQCGGTCSPGQVYCMKNNQCTRQSKCKGDYTGGVPWTMPDLLMLTPSSNTSSGDQKSRSVLISETFTMTSTGPEPKGANGRSINLLKVRGVTNNFGLWTKRKNKNKGKWENVTADSNLNIGHFIKFVPHRDIYGFGIDYIDMIDEITNTSRRLVQFLAPRPPKLELKVRTSSLQTNEDEPLPIPLAYLLDISGEDKLYWSKWSEALDFPRLANSNGLLDISNSVVKLWIEMLTRPNLPSSQGPQMTRGVSISLEKKPANVQKAKAHIAYSTDAGRTWKEQSPLIPLELELASPDAARKVMLQFIPGTSKSGKVVFLVEPFTKQLGGTMKKEKPEKITLEIISQNDAPRPRSGFDANSIPTLKPDQTNTGSTVKDLANIFYRDAEKDELGMVVLYAGGGPLGTWEYALKEAGPWKKISDLTENPLPSTPSKSRSYQGVVDLQKAMKVDTCDPTALLKSAGQSSKLTEKSVCSAALRAKGSGRELDTGQTGYSKNKGRSSMKGAQGVYEIENGNVTTSMNYPTVLALLLPPSAKIRFEPSDSSVAWGKVEAITHSKLLFLAWDTSDATDNQIARQNISLSTCGQIYSFGKFSSKQEFDCGGNGSMSLWPAVMVSEWSDCGGRLVEGGAPRSLDRCGVCGGDGSTCLDCANVVNGSATMECGLCVGGSSGLTAKRDCAGQCGEQNVEQKMGGATLCLLKSDSNFTLCDGTLDSGAYFNPCGICVEGETDVSKDSGMDKCGVCGGQNDCLGCDGKADSSASIDLCGKCLKKSDPNYDKCDSLGKVKPTIIDAAIFSLPSKAKNDASSASLRSAATTLEAQVAGLDENKKIFGCALINVETLVETNAVNAKLVGSKVKASLKSLEEGKYLLECTFGPKKMSKAKAKKLSSSDSLTKLKTGAEDIITVVDSRKMQINIVDQKELESGTINEVRFKVENGPPLENAICFLVYDEDKGSTPSSGPTAAVRKGNGRPTLTSTAGPEGNKPKRGRVVEVPAVNVTSDEVVCRLPVDTRPGVPKIGLALHQSTIRALRRDALEVPSFPLVLKAKPPQVLEAYVEDKVLIVKFDQNVASETPCNSLFNEGKLIGEEVECKFRSNKLLMRLGGDSRLKSNATLSFSTESQVIAKHADQDTAKPASGTFSVVLKKNEESSVGFQLLGDTQACNGSDVVVKISRIKGASPLDTTASWNVTWEWETSRASSKQSETLTMWENLRTIKETMVQSTTKTGHQLTFSGDLVRFGVIYPIVAELSTNAGLSDPQLLIVSAVNPKYAYRVNIIGPSRLRVDRKYVYSARISSCGDSEKTKISKLQYFWSLNSEGAGLPEGQSKKVTIPKELLRGGSEYIISVTVVSQEDGQDLIVMGKGTLSLTTESRGLEIITAADNLQIGSSAPVSIDASGSRDLDNAPGMINYRWSCLTETGSGCYVTNNGQPARLETILSEKQLTSSIFTLPPGTLTPSQSYKFIVEASKNGMSKKASVKLKVVPGELPIIATQREGLIVQPDKRIVIAAWITGPADLEAWWEAVEEPGYTYVDIFNVARAAKRTNIKDESKRRSFDLIIPRPNPEKGWAGLEDGTKYKFRLNAAAQLGEQAFSEVVLRTNTPPVAGTFKASPSSGEALLTQFTLEGSGWSDDPDDIPLQYTFGYRINGKTTWLITTTDEIPQAQVKLPADSGSSTVTPILRVCDNYGACTMKKAEDITVSLPNEVPANVLGSLGEEYSNNLVEDESGQEALGLASSVLDTLEAMDSKDQRAKMSLVVEFGLQQKMTEIQNRVKDNPEALLGSLDLLEGTNDLLGDLQPSQETMDDLLSLKREIVSVLTGINIPEKEKLGRATPGLGPSGALNNLHYPSNDEDLAAIRGRPNTRYDQNSRGAAMQSAMALHRGSFNPSNEEGSPWNGALTGEYNAGRGYRRNKRAADDDAGEAISTTSLKPLTPEQAIIMLNTDEQALDQEPGDISLMEELLNDVKRVAAGICLHMSSTSEPTDIIGSLAALRVVKSQLNDEGSDTLKDIPFLMANSQEKDNDFVKTDSYVTWGNLLKQYAEWECGKKDEDGESLPCYGACQVSVLFKEDYLSQSMRVKQPGLFRGHMVQTQFLNPENGEEINTFDRKFERFQYTLAVENATLPDRHILKCFKWSEDQWSKAQCGTRSSSDKDGVTMVECGCKEPGYVAVFGIDKSLDVTTPAPEDLTTDTATTTESSSTSTTRLPITTTFIRNTRSIKFKIVANYTAVVGNKREEFETNMTIQMASQLNVSLNNIVNLTVSEGSILVEFDLVEYGPETRIGGTTSKTAEDLYAELYDKVQNGELKILGLNSDVLKIPPQELDGSGPTVEEKEAAPMTPFIIAGVVGGLLLVVIVFLCIAIYIKNKKRMDKVQPLQSSKGSSQPPTYRSIHFEQDLDGTATSRRKDSPANRSLSSGGSYRDEEIFIQRRATPASSRGSGGTWSRNGSRASGRASTVTPSGRRVGQQEVPEPFRYNTPTKEQLDASGTIPPHIMEKIAKEREALPGTPGDDQ